MPVQCMRGDVTCWVSCQPTECSGTTLKRLEVSLLHRHGAARRTHPCQEASCAHGRRAADGQPDSRPKPSAPVQELYAPAPRLWLRPRRTADMAVQPGYMCPLYRTPERRGTLATTGHSTNFVMLVRRRARRSVSACQVAPALRNHGALGRGLCWHGVPWCLPNSSSTCEIRTSCLISDPVNRAHPLRLPPRAGTPADAAAARALDTARRGAALPTA